MSLWTATGLLNESSAEHILGVYGASVKIYGAKPNIGGLSEQTVGQIACKAARLIVKREGHASYALMQREGRVHQRHSIVRSEAEHAVAMGAAACARRVKAVMETASVKRAIAT